MQDNNFSVSQCGWVHAGLFCRAPSRRGLTNEMRKALAVEWKCVQLAGSVGKCYGLNASSVNVGGAEMHAAMSM